MVESHLPQGDGRRNGRPAGWLRLAALLLTACLASASASLAADARRDAPSSLLRIGLDGVAMSADPHRFNSADSRNLAFHVFEPLVLPDEALGITPWLATEWRMEGDRTWIFTLRPGVRFHDGKPLTAHDVAFTFCRLDAQAAGSMSGLIAGVEQVTARDAQTVQIATHGPMPLLPQMLTLFGILPAPDGWAAPYRPGGCALAAGGLAALSEDRFEKGLVAGTGPYRVTGFIGGGPIDLTRSDGYWGPRQTWEKVRLLPIPGGAARARALVAGDVDIINQVVPETLDFLTARKDIRVVDSQPLRTLLLTPNIAQADGAPGLLADPLVRRAVSLAIDRDALSRRIAQGSAAPADQLAPPRILGHTPDAALRFDQEQARQLLRQAGVTGEPRLRLVTVEPFSRIAEGIGRYLLAIGIKVDIRYIAIGQALPIMQGLDYDLFLGSWIAFTGELGYTGWELLHSRQPDIKAGSQNHADYRDAEVDALLSQAAMEPDAARRERLLQQVAVIASRDLPVIPVVHLSRRWAMRADIRFDGRVDGNTLATLITPAAPRTQ